MLTKIEKINFWKHTFDFLILYVYLLCILLFTNCTQQNKPEKTEKIADSLSIQTQDKAEDDAAFSEYSLYYLVSAESGYDYHKLKEVAMQLSQFLDIKFDTLGRYYNQAKKRIVLPDDDPDELFAGEYFFRRDPGNFISIEMQSSYPDTITFKSESLFKTFYSDSLKMFVFAGMYESKKQADSLLKLIKPSCKSATVIPAQIYMGCMH